MSDQGKGCLLLLYLLLMPVLLIWMVNILFPGLIAMTFGHYIATLIIVIILRT